MRPQVVAIAISCLVACRADSIESPLQEPHIVVVTFNSGTTEGLGHDGIPDDGYGSEEAVASDMHYGDGLAWLPVVEDTRRFFGALQPDIVAFQEIFHPENCAGIPPAAHAGFICETWQAGDPTLVQRVLDPTGEHYQVACHLGKPDKCLAVHRRLGTFAGCHEAVCLDHLDGATVNDCGGGSRVGRGIIELAAGGTLTVVSIHGSSGIEQADQDCRLRQFEQIFVDLDGEPAANGERNIILGDLNTDPGRMTDFDESAQLFATYAGAGLPFQFITAVGTDAQPTYTLFNIDHVVSDSLGGSCTHPGVTEGTIPVTETVYFDHKPAVCTMDVP